MSGFGQTDPVRKQAGVQQSSGPILATASHRTGPDANRIRHVYWGILRVYLQNSICRRYVSEWAELSLLVTSECQEHRLVIDSIPVTASELHAYRSTYQLTIWLCWEISLWSVQFSPKHSLNKSETRMTANVLKQKPKRVNG